MDPMVHRDEPTRITSAMIIGIVVAAIILVLIMVDLACFCINRTGILAAICDRVCTKQGDEEDPKMGR